MFYSLFFFAMKNIKYIHVALSKRLLVCLFFFRFVGFCRIWYWMKEFG